jgi:aminoglycoside phosphotransferase (APT) family kinase protein
MTEREPAALEAKLAEGRTAEVFAWEDGRVLKLFREGWGMAVAEHEAALAQVIYDAGAPSPQVFGATEVAGRVGVIYERIAGPSLLGELTAHPLRLPFAARTLAETHAAMHARTVAGLQSLREALARRIRNAAPLPTQHRDAALRALDAQRDGDALCHGDYHPDNVLLSARGPLVIDWENAALGDPLADVARTLLLLRAIVVYEPSPPARLVKSAARTAFSALYLRRYRQLAPFDPARLARWELPVTAARLSEGVTLEETYLLARVRRLCTNGVRVAPSRVR